MAQRFCSRCNSEVEDTGGFCLLGHDLRLEGPADSLKALRAEVNRTFDEARRELADVMAPAAGFAPEPEAELLLEAREPVHPATHPIRLDEALVIEGHPEEGREWADARCGSNEAIDVPVATRTTLAADPHGSVWEGLDETPSLSPGDPITTFAPSPRMDWGPRKSRFGRRRAPSDEQHVDV